MPGSPGGAIRPGYRIHPTSRRRRPGRGGPGGRDGRPFAYHRVAFVGGRVELVGTARQAGFPAAWHPVGGPMPPIERPPEP